jgi:hypothetical protein
VLLFGFAHPAGISGSVVLRLRTLRILFTNSPRCVQFPVFVQQAGVFLEVQWFISYPVRILNCPGQKKLQCELLIRVGALFYY